MSLILDGTNGLSDIDGSAATPAIRGTDANTGIFFPAADTIAFSEGGTEVARFNSSGNLVLNNALNSSSGVLATQNGMTGIAKAWVNFNGQTTPPTIRDSFNVSSVTRTGTGVFVVNFSNAMANANYSIIVSASLSFNLLNIFSPSIASTSSGSELAPTTTSTSIYIATSNAAEFNSKYISVAILSS